MKAWQFYTLVAVGLFGPAIARLLERGVDWLMMQSSIDDMMPDASDDTHDIQPGMPATAGDAYVPGTLAMPETVIEEASIAPSAWYPGPSTSILRQ